MSKYVKKLGSDTSYKRPKATYQEQLTADEIAEKLQGYERVDDISEVPLNTHLRYFVTEKDGSQVFRTGGFLHNKQNADTYVMLSNGKNIWSVQMKGAVFFKKMSQKDEIAAIHALYKKKLDQKDEIIDKLKTYITQKIGPMDNITAHKSSSAGTSLKVPRIASRSPSKSKSSSKSRSPSKSRSSSKSSRSSSKPRRSSSKSSRSSRKPRSSSKSSKSSSKSRSSSKPSRSSSKSSRSSRKY